MSTRLNIKERWNMQILTETKQKPYIAGCSVAIEKAYFHLGIEIKFIHLEEYSAKSGSCIITCNLMLDGSFFNFYIIHRNRHNSLNKIC